MFVYFLTEILNSVATKKAKTKSFRYHCNYQYSTYFLNDKVKDSMQVRRLLAFGIQWINSDHHISQRPLQCYAIANYR